MRDVFPGFAAIPARPGRPARSRSATGAGRGGSRIVELQLDGRLSAGDELLDGDLRDIRIVARPEGVFLHAATGQHGGLSAWRLDEAGGLAHLASTTYFTMSGLGLGRFEMATLDGSERLFLTGIGTGDLIGYALNDDGSLSPARALDLPGRDARSPGALATLPLDDGRTALYMADTATGTLRASVTDGAGHVTDDLARTGGGGAWRVEGGVTLTVAHAGARDFLLAADEGTQGVRSYRIDAATGALTAADSLGAADGIGIDTPTAMETVQAYGATWVVLAAAGTGSLSVMRLGADGGLRLTDHVLDTLDTRFAGVTALKTVMAGDRAFVIAGGADDGLSLFALLPGGRLVHLQSLANAEGLGLDNVAAIEAAVTGDRLQVFVASGTEPGLSQFSLPLGDLGTVVQAGASGAAAMLNGTASADLILGETGSADLHGEAGDDILVAGTGGGTLTGGPGADIFVLTPVPGELKITDFEAGIDRLDLSGFPMLHGLAQLAIRDRKNGFEAVWKDTTIIVLSADRTPLTADDIWPGGGLGTPDRMPAPAGPLRSVIRGTGAADDMEGTLGRDVIRGLGGADRVSAGSGADRLFGGKGPDRLDGGAGRDRIKGGAGADTLIGGGRADQLKGGAGDDRLSGGAAGDDLFGGKGRDRLMGGDGKDHLSGGAGKDVLTGGDGADLFIFAGSGFDRITDFSPGQDRVRLDLPGLTFADLDFLATDRGTRMTAGDHTVLFDGLAPDMLTADDFLFG